MLESGSVGTLLALALGLLLVTTVARQDMVFEETRRTAAGVMLIVIGVLHTARMDLYVVKNYGDRIQAHYLALAGVVQLLGVRADGTPVKLSPMTVAQGGYRFLPKQPLVLHRHEHGRVLIALTDGQLEVVDHSGKKIGRYDWKAGKAYWLDADPQCGQPAA